MSLSSKIKQQGFTIVELLIVIVVIGILAGITIVAYSGITARANTTKAQTNAVSAQKVAEAFNADNSNYPTTAASFATGSVSAKLPSGISVIPDAATSTATAANGLTTVAYACLTTCATTTGGRIQYWNFTTSAVVAIYVGAGASGGTFVYPAT